MLDFFYVINNLNLKMDMSCHWMDTSWNLHLKMDTSCQWTIKSMVWSKMQISHLIMSMYF